MTNVIANFKISGLFQYLLSRFWMKILYAINYNKGKSQSINFNNSIVNLKLEDLEQLYLYKDCIREPENTILYKALAKYRIVDLFVDIGANCGHVACSVMQDFNKIVLIEPNPYLFTILKSIFANSKNVTLNECAIVSSPSLKTVTLSVPVTSSGLASIGDSHLSLGSDCIAYEVAANTLDSILINEQGRPYIKIDVEGLEFEIIKSALGYIQSNRPVVGFEALTKERALHCSELFVDYSFYCSRFNFMESGGALSKSLLKLFSSLFSGHNIQILKIENISAVDITNYSQLIAVPNEISCRLEKAVSDFSIDYPTVNLNNFRSWSKDV